MSNTTNDRRLEDLQAYLDTTPIEDVRYDEKHGYYTVTEKTVEQDDDTYPASITINVLPDEYQNTLNLIRNIEVVPTDFWKEDGVPFTLNFE